MELQMKISNLESEQTQGCFFVPYRPCGYGKILPAAR